MGPRSHNRPSPGPTASATGRLPDARLQWQPNSQTSRHRDHRRAPRGCAHLLTHIYHLIRHRVIHQRSGKSEWRRIVFAAGSQGLRSFSCFHPSPSLRVPRNSAKPAPPTPFDFAAPICRTRAEWKRVSGPAVRGLARPVMWFSFRSRTIRRRSRSPHGNAASRPRPHKRTRISHVMPLRAEPERGWLIAANAASQIRTRPRSAS